MGVLISPIKPGESVVAARPVPKTVVTIILSSYVDVVGNMDLDVGDFVGLPDGAVVRETLSKSQIVAFGNTRQIL